jgi:hypothetical protein
MSAPDPQAIEIVFDPHVVVALSCLAIAFLIVLLVALVPVEDDPVRRKQNRRD